MLKREPIRERLSEGRGVVSMPLTAEERRSQARAARRGLEQMKAELEMAENKAERRRDAEWCNIPTFHGVAAQKCPPLRAR